MFAPDYSRQSQVTTLPAITTYLTILLYTAAATTTTATTAATCEANASEIVSTTATSESIT